MRDATLAPDHLKVRALRLARDLTQEELAIKVGCSKRTIENVEAGRRVKKSNLDDIAEALGCEPGDLVCPCDDEEASYREEVAYRDFERCTGHIRQWLGHIGPSPDHPAAQSLRGQLLVELLRCLHHAANHSIAYTARVGRHGEPRDLDRELELSDLWLRVGTLLIQVFHDDRNLRFGLSELVFLKSRYWADMDAWTDEQIEAAGIQLDPLVRQIELLLTTGATTSSPTC